MTTAVDRVKNRRGEGGRLRADILRSGTEILDETGQEQSVTLRAVARRIGIAAPSIYRHFPDRESILFAVVEQAFAELAGHLRTAQASAHGDPRARLTAMATAYLDFARRRPERYRIMFGGVWDVNDAVRAAAVTRADAGTLGLDALTVFMDPLLACIAAGCSTSTDPFGDSVALWVALHGLAHQQGVIPHFPWPTGIADRLVDRIALLRTATTG